MIWRYFLSTLALLVVITLVAVSLFVVSRNRPEWEVGLGSAVVWENFSGEVVPSKEYPLKVFRSAQVVDKQVVKGDEVEKGERVMSLILGNDREVKVYAHRSGIITFVTPASDVENGEVLIKIADNESNWGEIVLTGSTNVSVGDKAKLTYSQREISAEVTDLKLPSDGEDGFIHLRSREELPLYDSFQVQIITAFRNNILVVPKEAVIKEGGGFFVFVKGGWFGTKKKVDLGLEGNEYAEVVAGLNEGERVLLRK